MSEFDLDNMDEIDLNKADAYSQHLADVNETNDVIATEDIRNEQGAMVVARGSRLQKNVADQISKHVLNKPLDSSVRVESSIDRHKLLEALRNFVDETPDMKAIHEEGELDDPMQAFCRQYGTHEILVQKITVMESQLPELYKKSLFCAWMSLAIMKKKSVIELDHQSAFLAGLAHDMGMLHIDPEIVKSDTHTNEEIRTLHSHVLIGKMIVKNCGKLPAAVSHAVEEHHEVCDGSGYPHSLTDEKLNVVGQIVALTDQIYHLRFERFPDGDYNLANILPVIQLNKFTHFEENYDAAARVIRAAKLQPQRHLTKENVTSFTEDLIKERDKIMMSCQIISQLTAKLPHDCKIRSVRVALNCTEHLWFTLRDSGVLCEGLLRWIQHMHDEVEEEFLIEMEEIDLMYKELTWQTKQVAKKVHMAINHEDAKEFIPNLDVIEGMSRSLNTAVKGKPVKGLDPSMINIDKLLSKYID